MLPFHCTQGELKVRVAGSHADVERARPDALEHPGSLRVSPFGLCEGCQQTVYREPGTLTLLLLRRSGSMNPASLARRAPVPGLAARRPSIGSGQSIPAYLAGRPFACGHS